MVYKKIAKQFVKNANPYVRALSTAHTAYRAAKSVGQLKQGYKNFKNSFRDSNHQKSLRQVAAWKKRNSNRANFNGGLSQEVTTYRKGKMYPKYIDNARDQTLKYTIYLALELQSYTQRAIFQSGQLLWSTSDLNTLLTQLTTAPNTTSNLLRPATMKIKYGQLDSTAEVVNQTNSPVKLTIYVCRFRQDTNTTWVNPTTPVVLATQANNTPVADILNGLGAGNTYSGADPMTYDQPGVTPYMSPYFCTKYKVENTENYVINAGATIIHKIVDKHTGTLNMARQNTSAQVAQGNLTLFRLFHLQGTVANAGHQTNPGIAAGEVSIIETSTYHLASQLYNAPFVVAQAMANTNLATATTVMSEMLDVAATITEA